ncbi:MAG: methylated-DNA--[protein]-cysteine S-methyltransferase [Candidatus Wallbacteria bacterium]|nr:methylated-DNA--[protein]-cysteine S-methyltransferase [Candidatus Wallbacteria bacterium]
MNKKLTVYYSIFQSRIGSIFIAATDKGLCRLYFPSSPELLREVRTDFNCELVPDEKRLAPVKEQILKYLSGKLRTFDCRIDFITGTDFQKKVWQALLEIPYGETRTYRWVAERIGCPKGFRAVGGANNRNPISLIVPCHRVIGADGSMTGYAGPSEANCRLKRELLEMEGAL